MLNQVLPNVILIILINIGTIASRFQMDRIHIQAIAPLLDGRVVMITTEPLEQDYVIYEFDKDDITKSRLWTGNIKRHLLKDKWPTLHQTIINYEFINYNWFILDHNTTGMEIVLFNYLDAKETKYQFISYFADQNVIKKQDFQSPDINHSWAIGHLISSNQPNRIYMFVVDNYNQLKLMGYHYEFGKIYHTMIQAYVCVTPIQTEMFFLTRPCAKKYSIHHWNRLTGFVRDHIFYLFGWGNIIIFEDQMNKTEWNQIQTIPYAEWIQDDYITIINGTLFFDVIVLKINQFFKFS